MGSVLSQIPIRATEPVQAALGDVGRTEDLRFSPDGTLLVLAGFTKKRCLVLRVGVETGEQGPLVTIDDHMYVTSDGISNVHGVDFLDSRTLALANRDRRATVIRLPDGEPGGKTYHAPCLEEIRSRPFCRVKAPGSIGVLRRPDGSVSVLVCNNYIHRVTRHELDPQRDYRVTRNEVFLRRGLNLPDGVGVSPDGEWVAVSGHHSNDVRLFSMSRRVGRLATAAGVMTGVNFPHGLRFTADGRFLLVAGAGSPVINVYERGETWAGEHAPVCKAVVLDADTFTRGRLTAEEGGPKGIDIHPAGVVAVTCEEQTLALFALSAFTGE